MQVACANCQLSFQAPDGATGLVCPICRSPLRAPDAQAADSGAGGTRQTLEWAGGSLDDLISLLSAPALSARVEVLSGGAAVGEVHVIAGGVSDAIYEGRSSHEALDRLRAVKGSRFRIEPRLPNPNDGDLTFPGPDQGKLEERPLAHLMRYCEDYVLTAAIEVWRGNENAKVEYRRGEIVGVTVGGIDAPERLAEVMQWASGSYRIVVPRLSLPETAPKTAAPPPAAVVTPRASAAATKTIFGMPAVDVKALAAGAQARDATRATTSSTASGPTEALAAAPSPAASVPTPVAPAAPAASSVEAVTGAPAAKTAAPPRVQTPASAIPAVAPADRAAAARTIFGVAAPNLAASGAAAAGSPGSGSSAAPTQTPAARVAQPVASPATPSPATAAAPPSVAASVATPAAPRAEVAAKAAAEEKAVAAAAVAARSADKPSSDKPSSDKPSSAETRPARATSGGAKERGRGTGAPASPARDERTQPAVATRPAETPIWTYVGVGFVFGLALLGVYWLVMVVAN